MFLRNFNNIFGLTFFIDCLIGTYLIGFSSFTLSSADEFDDFMIFLVYCSPMIFVIFLPCFFCNNLTLALDNLMYSVMHSNWMKAEKKNKMLLIIMMENLKISMKINFHKTMDINLDTFINIVQKAYSLYAVLQSVKN